MRLLRAAAFGACALGDLPPALDRRRIAAPRLRTRHRGGTRLARRAKVRHNLSGTDVGLKTRSVSKTEQMFPVCIRNRGSEDQFSRRIDGGARLSRPRRNIKGLGASYARRSEPEVSWFDTPVIIDNQAGGIITKAFHWEVSK